jgi:Na+-translocating ferredoxin:NAD+ oxidoreductase RnfE subunit
LSRVQFAHPVSVREHRPISLTCMIIWLGSMTWLAIAQHDIRLVRFLMIVASLWTVVQVLMRLAQRPSGVFQSTPGERETLH